MRKVKTDFIEERTYLTQEEMKECFSRERFS